MSSTKVPLILEQKWRHFAGVLDHNKDGLVTRRDHIELAERAISEGKIDPNSVRAIQIRRKLGQTFDDIFGPIKGGQPVTYDEVVESFWLRGEQLRRVVDQNLEIFFDMIDASGDGLIQLDEFRQFFHIFYLNVEEAEGVFNTIDVERKGELDMNTFMSFSMKFFFSVDSNHPSKHFFGMLPQ